MQAHWTTAARNDRWQGLGLILTLKSSSIWRSKQGMVILRIVTTVCEAGLSTAESVKELDLQESSSNSSTSHVLSSTDFPNQLRLQQKSLGKPLIMSDTQQQAVQNAHQERTYEEPDPRQMLPPRAEGYRSAAIRESRIKDRPYKPADSDTMKIKIELDLEVEVCS